VTGNDVTWPQVSRSDPEVPSFDRKSPGSVCRGPKTGIYCTFYFLQGCSSQREAVTWQEMMSRDLRWTEVTRRWRHLTGSHLEVAVEGRKLAYTLHFTSYKALTVGGGSHVTGNDSRDLRWPEVTLMLRHLTRSHLEVAIEGRRLAYTVHFTTCKPVSRRRRQSHDSKWHHMTLNGSGLEVTSFDRKSPWSVCRGPKTGIYCTFHFLQGCSSQEEAVTSQEMTSRDLRWPEVARKTSFDWKSRWSGCRGPRIGIYSVHFTTYKAVSRRSQSRDRKWRHVTSGDRKCFGSDVIWPEITWKWL